MSASTPRGWFPVVIFPLVSVWCWPASGSRWTLMWLLATEIYLGCKWLTWRRTPVESASFGRHAGYLLLWPGMDAKAFLGGNPGVIRPPVRDWFAATLRLAIGVVLLFDLGGLVRPLPPLIVAWAGMLGYMLVLHFGLFQLLSLAWRHNGVDARPLMDHPLHATSVADLWGRRWNTAFRDLMHRFLFRPFVPRFGPSGAIFLGFLMSGLVHDVVMSVPAGGGYGGPTLYFVLLSAGLLFEKSVWGRRIGLGSGWRGWLFSMFVLVGPAALLIHGPFVNRVVLDVRRLHRLVDRGLWRPVHHLLGRTRLGRSTAAMRDGIHGRVLGGSLGLAGRIRRSRTSDDVVAADRLSPPDRVVRVVHAVVRRSGRRHFVFAVKG